MYCTFGVTDNGIHLLTMNKLNDIHDSILTIWIRYSLEGG